MIFAPTAPIDALPQPRMMLPAPAPVVNGGAFSSLLASGLENVNTKVIDADNMVRAMLLDDSIPVHQVTYALEQARLSLELMTQVRSRLIEGYQQLMNMQL